MIPTIGILIAGYVCLRCLEILANIKKIESRGSRAVIALTALCLLLFSIGGIFSLSRTGSALGEQLLRR